MYQWLVRWFLFNRWDDPEDAHEFALRMLERLHHSPRLLAMVEDRQRIVSERLSQEVVGLRFENPIGLAAGMDKNGRCPRAWQALGFGFLEIGTVTSQPQAGNDRPRMMRIPKSGALRNWLGFNNYGAELVASLLPDQIQGLHIPLGINVGKSKVTDVKDPDAVKMDHISSIDRLYRFADYLVINVSSPNTPGLRGLADKDSLLDLLTCIRSVLPLRAFEEGEKKGSKPVFLKISPDMSDEALADVCEIWTRVALNGGIIATNTTTSRAGLARDDIPEQGGTSGQPLTARSLEVVRAVRARLPHVPIIGVGGIASGQQAFRMLAAGANLVQVLTGLVYEGPDLIRRMNKELLALMDAHGIERVSDIFYAMR